MRMGFGESIGVNLPPGDRLLQQRATAEPPGAAVVNFRRNKSVPSVRSAHAGRAGSEGAVVLSLSATPIGGWLFRKKKPRYERRNRYEETAEYAKRRDSRSAPRALCGFFFSPVFYSGIQDDATPAPVGAVFQRRLPPCASAIWRLKTRPIRSARLRRENGTNRFDAFGSPAPSSSIHRSSMRPSVRHATRRRRRSRAMHRRRCEPVDQQPFELVGIGAHCDVRLVSARTPSLVSTLKSAAPAKYVDRGELRLRQLGQAGVPW